MDKLLVAVKMNDIDLVTSLIKQGEKIDDEHGKIICSSACLPDTLILELLIKNGANIHIEGDKPLMMAIDSKNLNAVNVLLNNGANIHSRNNYAIRISAVNNYLDILHALIYDHNIHISKETERDLEIIDCEFVMRMIEKRDLKDKLSSELAIRPEPKIKRKQPV